MMRLVGEEIPPRELAKFQNENETENENQYHHYARSENPSHRGSENQKNFDWMTACEKCLHFRAKRGLFAMLSKRNFSRNGFGAT